MTMHNCKERISYWLILFLRFGFGVLLIYASVDKILHPVDFAGMVANYRVIGEDLSNWAAVFVPYLEVIVGLLLIFGVWTNAAAVINSLLMAAFLGLVTQAYIRGLDISCGCFSVEEGHVIDPLKVLTNLFYAVMSLVLVYLVFKSSKESRDAHHESPG
ncbi:DoxX family membrane protein [bacterium]|nr:DoxX family membrane protein [bacterium]